jgi:DNA-binding transcriptional LysR family regulator
MARFDTNRSAEMEVFVLVVDLGGFTQAARKLRLTPSGVSKLISRLETRLGSRLINRTTRKLTLTEEGQAFYQRSLRILGEIDEAEREAASGAIPRGRLTVNSNIPFGMLHVLPLIPRFLAEHPEVTLDLVLTDTLIDLMQERADVAPSASVHYELHVSSPENSAPAAWSSSAHRITSHVPAHRRRPPILPITVASAGPFRARSAAGRSSAASTPRKPRRRRPPASATAKPPAALRLVASVSPVSPSFTSAPTSNPDVLFRFFKTTIPATAKTSTPSMSATQRRSRPACVRSSIFWRSMCV